MFVRNDYTTPSQAINSLGFIPEDRKAQGCF